MYKSAIIASCVAAAVQADHKKTESSLQVYPAYPAPEPVEEYADPDVYDDEQEEV